jgi:hypothetical protein
VSPDAVDRVVVLDLPGGGIDLSRTPAELEREARENGAEADEASMTCFGAAAASLAGR